MGGGGARLEACGRDLLIAQLAGAIAAVGDLAEGHNRLVEVTPRVVQQRRRLGELQRERRALLIMLVIDLGVAALC